LILKKKENTVTQFEWMHTVGPTALKILPSGIFGEHYQNGLKLVQHDINILFCDHHSACSI
jgi:hypothetical protein